MDIGRAVLLLVCVLALEADGFSFAHNAAQSSYPGVPAHLELVSVAVFHRHGDRSQVSRSPGPAFPHTTDIDDVWKALMPTAESQAIMGAAASDKSSIADPSAAEVEGRGVQIDYNRADVSALDQEVYSGWERANYPYGMLTEKGFQEMHAVGLELRRRYSGALFPESGVKGDSVYARATNFCRTKQSLRSLLAGLQGTEAGDAGGVAAQDRVQLQSVAKEQETMFPQAGGPCTAIAMRRAELYADDYIALNYQLPGGGGGAVAVAEGATAIQTETETTFSALETVVDETYGYSAADEPINWMTVREVMVCQHSHDVPGRPEAASAEVVAAVDSLAGFMWYRLFADPVLNRLAIGRFLGEVAGTVDAAVRDPRGKTKMMVWSGHDSTLVPVLSALGLVELGWPPYASHLEMEFAKDADGELFVRAIYNNEERQIEGCDGVWCPYFRFKRRMANISMSPGAYAAECGVDGDTSHAESESDKAARGAMETEIRATTGGN